MDVYHCCGHPTSHAKENTNSTLEPHLGSAGGAALTPVQLPKVPRAAPAPAASRLGWGKGASLPKSSGIRDPGLVISPAPRWSLVTLPDAKTRLLPGSREALKLTHRP